MTQETLRYSRTAMFLHWAIALLLVFNFGLGERTEDLRDGPELFWVMQLHKSIGITVLLLSVWRLGLRLTTKRPPKALDGRVFQFLSSAVHWGFYAVMIIAPLTGWVLVSTAKVQLPTLLFGTIPWPHLPNFGHDVHEATEEAHEILAKLILPLLALHLIGAARHQFLMRDALVERMVPAKRVSIALFALLTASIVAAFFAGKSWPSPPVAEAGEPLPDFQSASAPPAVRGTSQSPSSATPATVATQAPPSPKEISSWQVAPGGHLGFTVMVNGAPVKGSFSQWKADIRFDPDHLDSSSVHATVRLASVSTGESGRDAMLQGDEFFGSASPTARFTAERFRARGANMYQADGALNMKGMSHPVSLSFSLNIKGDAAKARGNAQLDRGDFHVGTGQFEGTDTIAERVNIDFAFNAQRVPPLAS